MPAITTPLANRKSGDIDFVVVGGNTEGEYWSVGGRIWEGSITSTYCARTSSDGRHGAHP